MKITVCILLSILVPLQAFADPALEITADLFLIKGKKHLCFAPNSARRLLAEVEGAATCGALRRALVAKTGTLDARVKLLNEQLKNVEGQSISWKKAATESQAALAARGDAPWYKHPMVWFAAGVLLAGGTVGFAVGLTR
jgi:hypothetical protein